MNNFIFKKNITDSQIAELINYSVTDSQIIKNTSDKTRFADLSAYKSWFTQKKPTIYTLTDKSNHLYGLIWFESDTFAIRLYDKARGQGLSYDFMKQAFDDFKPKNVWLKCSADNIPANLTYKKFGFKQTTEPDENNKIIMVLKNHPSQS